MMPGYRGDDRSVIRIPSLPLPAPTAYRLTLPLLPHAMFVRGGRPSIVHAHSAFVTGLGAGHTAEDTRLVAQLPDGSRLTLPIEHVGQTSLPGRGNCLRRPPRPGGVSWQMTRKKQRAPRGRLRCGHADWGRAEPGQAVQTAPPPLTGRRSAACGKACAQERPCSLVEIRAADLVARSTQDAWLRVWTEVYVLAHLVNRPRPRVPVPLRQRWAGLDERLRECALTTAVDRAVLGRGQALRESYDPAGLASASAASAAAMLDGGKGAGTMPGTAWVIPQLQWLHELERVCPFGGPPPDPFAAAPPLDYSLPDLADRADVKVGQRVSGLRRHALSMEVPRNRLVAWSALLGEDDQAAFIEDLAAVAIGVSHRGQLGKAAGEMGVTGWLEAVLSWPRRFIVGADDLAASSTTRQPDPVAG